MRRSRFVLPALIVGSFTLAACTGATDESIEPAGTGGDDVTGGEIIVSGDLSGGTATTDADPAPTPAQSTTSPDPDASPGPSDTAAPGSTAAPTSSADGNGDGNAAQDEVVDEVEDEVVGDGPVLTTPGEGDGAAQAPGVGIVPIFFAIEATTTTACGGGGAGTVSLRWEVAGAETVDVAIGAADKIFRLGQPPAGTLDVPLDCAQGSRYFVVATNPEGTTMRSVTVAPG